MTTSLTGLFAIHHPKLRSTAVCAAVARNALAMRAIRAALAMCLAGETGEFVSETPRPLPGAIGCESIAGGGSFAFAYQVAFTDHTVHLRRQQVFIGGQEGPEVTDGEGLAEALSLIPVHDLQDLVAPVDLIERLHRLPGAHLIVRMFHIFPSASFMHVSIH